MKQIYVAQNIVEAEIVCSELRNLGFDAIVQGDLMAIPTAPFPSIWVQDEEEAAAIEACKSLSLNSDSRE